MEQRFRKMALSQELWGEKLGEYLDEDALQCWLDLKRSEKLIHKEQGAPAGDQGPTAYRKLSAERKTAAQVPAANGKAKHNTDNSRDVNVGVSIEDHQSVTTVELLPWWREHVADEGSKMEGMLCSVSVPTILPVEVVGRASNGAHLRIDRTMKSLTICFGRECLTGDYLVGPVPYDIVLGLDWLTKHKVSWYFQ
ncbi:hypothetical protein EPH_0003210 [Eimeria praecox]|uniref:Uncharacterized protein n=1 Tax=Eimeria praecox TaxID=51316 RepID=U6G5V7_9EIME|nr:hypothetical protein EPH_0003210 [Eimeria praecox]